MSIGQRITELRTQRNMSQNQLAKAMEISRQAVSKWENGQSTPDAAKMIKLADVLDTDVEYLTTGRAVVPSRPPVVLTEVQTIEVERVVEKPVVQVVEKIVEREVEVPVEVPVEVRVVEYVEKPVIKRTVRTKYMRNPLEYALVGIGGLILGLLIGLFF